MSVEWLQYKGKSILYYDCQGLRGEILMQNLENLHKVIREYPGDILLLINEEGMVVSQEYQERAKRMTEETTAYVVAKYGRSKVQKTAMIGAHGLKLLLLNGYNRDTNQGITAFSSAEEAKEWLVS